MPNHFDLTANVAAADPRRVIGAMDDSIPILLLPVRLETRFNTARMREGRQRPQLWVRIFPDDCSIDTFEDTPSESEVETTKLYWIQSWEAGGIDPQERGAWRGLVSGHGSGRAEWLVSHYQPLNLAAKPSKQNAADVILTIATNEPLPGSEAQKAVDFWKAVWLADGDKTAHDAAVAWLQNAVGAQRAAVIAERYKPLNVASKPTPPLAKQDVALSVEFVVFPKDSDVQTTKHSWSRAPVASMLPGCFVFIGYRTDREPVVVPGNPVRSPLVVGPNPSAPPNEQLQQQDGRLIVPDPLQWLVDFDRAEKEGMGIRVDLDTESARAGFDRVLVVGLRGGGDPAAAQTELETLLAHHRESRKGLALVPQGTATNNTDGAPAGFERGDDPDASYDDLKSGTLFTSEPRWLDKRDGQWLAEYLGVDPEVFAHARHAGDRDQADARAMNTALWPATLGYWMETMMQPIFDSDDVDRTRDFFGSYVSGRGAIPAIRIGRQPYGILPATAFSRIQWPYHVELRERGERLRAEPEGVPFLGRLYHMLRGMNADWTTMAGVVSYAGKPGDPHATLLDIVGLHPTSVEFWQRHAESIDELWNRLSLSGRSVYFGAMIAVLQIQSSMALLKRLGYREDDVPDMLEKVFFGAHNLLKGPLIDDPPPSETEPIRPSTTDGKNYIEWLIKAANTSLDALYAQDGFVGGKAPEALLYVLLRHALQLGYHDTGLKLFFQAELLDAEGVRAAKLDRPFIHVAANAVQSESKYVHLVQAAPQITGSQTTVLGDYIGASLFTLFDAETLKRQVEALERLKGASTARLERALAEHVDTCSYRLDAWLLGLVAYQLARMRNLADGEETEPRTGIHVGAYAWLEDLRPESRQLERPTLDDEQASVFHPDVDPPLMRDSSNQGYIHAPSLNQAVAAAVLRNGFIADARPESRETLAVQLTSERVRRALAILEGIREGQSLGALLGYQFERGLHDRHNLAEVDKFIYDIRKEFPLRSDRLTATTTAGQNPPVPIEAIEARNVVNGLAFVEHVKAAPQNRTYPFGKQLPAASAAEAAAINAEVERILDSHDAVADLALAEGVYQAVLGNYDRVASTYDAYSKGNFPPEPQIVRTPPSGTALTHRIGLHLNPAADPSASPVAGVTMTPRAHAEPSINEWLAAMLPLLNQVGCVVSFVDPATAAFDEREVTLKHVNVQPIDLIRLIPEADTAAMSELDDRIVAHTLATHDPAPGSPIEIRYRETKTAAFSVFEVIPLIRHLRRLVQTARPLRPSDLVRTKDATESLDANPTADAQRVVDVRDAIVTLRASVETVRAAVQSRLDNVETERDQLIDEIDGVITDLTTLLSRVALFGVPQAGWGFLFDWKRRVFSVTNMTAGNVAATWTARLTAFDGVVTEYDALPGGATGEERFALLLRAERLVTTTVTHPMTDPATVRAALPAKRGAFEAARDAFAAVASTTQTRVNDLIDDVDSLPNAAEFDAEPPTFEPAKQDVVHLAEDATRVCATIIAELDRRLGASQDRFDEHDAAAEPALRVRALDAAAKALLGDDFVIVPRFTLATAAGDQIESSRQASTSGGLFDYLTNTLGIDFPIDTWLYGVARTREATYAWEQTVMLTGAFGRPEPELTPMQLPFVQDEQWLAMDVPPDREHDGERLLYTAHFAKPFDKTKPQCGLLIDEWSETIPADDATTGIAFHYDRPNSESPQSWLLVTPSESRGRWRWDDLIDALSDTLDLAKVRAVEPAHVDASAYAPFLPATVTATTYRELTISANLAIVNGLREALGGE